MAAARDLYTEQELRTWISSHLEETSYPQPKDFLFSENDFRQLLRSGEALC